jgi:hypothetical protein
MEIRTAARRPSPALLVSVIALVFALGGVATALPGKKTIDKNDLARNVVRSKHIKRDQVRPGDLAPVKVVRLDLINGWVPVEGAGTPSAVKDGFGFVHLEGTIRDGTDPGTFVLPAGFRPPHNVVEIVSAGGEEVARMVIRPDGATSVVTATASQLEGVSFRAGD